MTTRDAPASRPTRAGVPERDRALIAWIDAHHAPPAQTAAQRAAFDAALDARLERVRRRRAWLRWASPLAAAASLACLAWALLPAGPRAPERSGRQETTLLLSAWERGIVLGDLDALERDDSDALVLPADYAAIDGVFFEGS